MTFISDVKRLDLLTRASKMALNASPRCRDLRILLGHLTSVLPAVPLIRLHSRYLQLDLNKFYRSEGLFPSCSIVNIISSGSTLDRLSGVCPLRVPDLASPRRLSFRCGRTHRTRDGASTSKGSCCRVSGPPLRMPQPISIRREGGTVSRPLLCLPRQILLLAQQRHVQILTAFVSTEENLLANAASCSGRCRIGLPIKTFH